MKLKLAFALIAVTLVTPATALAEPSQLKEDVLHFGLINPIKEEPLIDLISVKPAQPNPPPPAPVVYAVVSGDNLSKIGTAHNTEWQRLWAKNTQLTHPDVLKVGDQITIPLSDEQLAREIPAAVALPALTPGVTAPRQASAAPRAPANYGGGNTYYAGYCTWYVKNRRGASLPNGLGNANTWYSRAAGMGMAVGSAPRAGAVGTTTRGAEGHVVFVESVNGDGSINISEMNAPIFGKTTYRTASASEFLYIY
jgi:surface antigen